MHRGVNVFISMIEEGPNRDSFLFQGVDILRYHHEKPTERERWETRFNRRDI